jgi:drug/metabolite transporter (DMT)-like permease
MEYALIIGTVILFSIQTLSFKVFNRHFMLNLDSYYLFNSLYFSVSVAVFALSNTVWEPVRLLTVLMAGGFGILFLAAILLYMRAMALGPLSYTTLLFSLALLVPILFGALFWREPVRPLQAVGLVLLLLTFMLAGRSDNDDKRPNLRWLLLCLAACLGNGSLMTLSKAHQMQDPGLEIEEFLIIAFGTAALLSLLLFLLRRSRNRVSLTHLRSRRFAWLVLVTGLTTGTGNLIALYLTGRIPAIIQFPSMSGGIVIVTTIMGAVLYKEQPTRRSALGLLIGLAALVLLSV